MSSLVLLDPLFDSMRAEESPRESIVREKSIVIERRYRVVATLVILERCVSSSSRLDLNINHPIYFIDQDFFANLNTHISLPYFTAPF